MRVVCDFMVLFDRNHRLLYYDAFTGQFSECADFRRISVIFGAKFCKVRREADVEYDERNNLRVRGNNDVKWGETGVMGC